MQPPFPRNGNHRRAVAAWDYLVEFGEGSAPEMAEAMGVNRNTVHVALRFIRKKYPGLIRITKWERYDYEATGRVGGGQMTPVYAFGAEPDAPKPRPKSRKLSDKHSYERRKATFLLRETKRRIADGRVIRTPVWLKGLL